MIGAFGKTNIGLRPSEDLKDMCYACMLANDPIELRIGTHVQSLMISSIEVGYGEAVMDSLTIEVKPVGVALK